MPREKPLAVRLDEARRELDQCAEWLGRIQVDVAALDDRQLPELVGVAEIAEMLGISVDAASMRRKRGMFPAPAATLRCGHIWLRSDIEAMIENRAA